MASIVWVLLVAAVVCKTAAKDLGGAWSGQDQSGQGQQADRKPVDVISTTPIDEWQQQPAFDPKADAEAEVQAKKDHERQPITVNFTCTQLTPTPVSITVTNGDKMERLLSELSNKLGNVPADRLKLYRSNGNSIRFFGREPVFDYVSDAGTIDVRLPQNLTLEFFCRDGPCMLDDQDYLQQAAPQATKMKDIIAQMLKQAADTNHNTMNSLLHFTDYKINQGAGYGMYMYLTLEADLKVTQRGISWLTDWLQKSKLPFHYKFKEAEWSDEYQKGQFDGKFE